MPAEDSRAILTVDERAYLYSRLFLVALLSVLYPLDVPLIPPLSRAIYLFALAILVSGTAGVWWFIARSRIPADRALLWIAPPDLLAIFAFCYLTAGNDSFYAVCFIYVVIYALMVSRRAAIAISLFTASAYLAGHLIGLPPSHWFEAILIGLKSIAVPLVAFVVANSVRTRRTREAETRTAAAETEVLNVRLELRVAELQAISDVTELVHSTLDIDDVGPSVLDIVARALAIDACCLFILDRAESETLFSACIGTGTDDIRDHWFDAEHGGVAGHLTCIPVFDHVRTLVLFCADAAIVENLDEDNRRMLSAVASELVVAVENSRLYKLTRRLAVTDELTSLANYRNFQQRLDEELARSKRFNKYVSLLLLDVDDFKRFSDSQGHLAGDAVLAELGGVLSSAVRQVDLVARYGGEEFAIVLPETEAAGAYVAAEKVREAVSEHHFKGANGRNDQHFTISIGLATYPTHASSKDSLLRAADDAVYHAKASGKNKVSSAGQLAARTEFLPAPSADDLSGE